MIRSLIDDEAAPLEPVEIDTSRPVQWLPLLVRRIGMTDPATLMPADPGPLPTTTYADHWIWDAARQDTLLEAVLRGGTLAAVGSAEVSIWDEDPSLHEWGQPGNLWETGNARRAPGWDAPTRTDITPPGLPYPIQVWAALSSTDQAWTIHSLAPIHHVDLADAVGLYLDSTFQQVDNDATSGMILVGTRFNTVTVDVEVWPGNAQVSVTGGDGDGILGAWLQGGAYTGSSTLALGFLDDLGAEPAGGWYSRQAVSFAAISSHRTSNVETLTWPAAGAFTLSRVGLWSALSGGRLIQDWDLFYTPPGRAIAAGQAIIVYPGAIRANSV